MRETVLEDGALTREPWLGGRLWGQYGHLTRGSLKLSYSGDFAAAIKVQAYQVAFEQIFDRCSFDRAKMDKGLDAVIHFDEPKAIIPVEPFYTSLRHVLHPGSLGCTHWIY
jgi:hypothetical protein